MISIAPVAQDVQSSVQNSVADPNTPNANKDQIIDAQARQIKTLTQRDRANVEYISRLENLLAQEGLTLDAETAELSTSQTDVRQGKRTDSGTEQAYSELRDDNQQQRENTTRTQKEISRSQGTARTLGHIAIGLTFLLTDALANRDAQLDRCYARINDMESEKAYTHRLHKNKSINGNEKLALQAIREQILTLRVNPFEETQISLQNIAEKAGFSEWTARRAATTLDQLGLIHKRNDKAVIGNDGKPHTHSFIALTEKAIDLDGIERPIEKQHGGSRTCKCGSENVKSYPIHVCLDCGNVEFSTAAYDAISTLQSFHVENPPNECMNDEKHLAFERESTSISEPVEVSHSVDQPKTETTTELHHDEKHLAFESVALALATMLQSYKVKHNPHMTCSCGCQLWRTTMNDFLCARCEPSPIWPNKYNEALRTLYPGKNERKVQA